MLGDHQRFIGGDHPGRDTASLPAYTGLSIRVGFFIEIKPDPVRVTADPLADWSRILTDPPCENQRIEAAEGGGERSQLTGDPVYEKVNCFSGIRLFAFQERSHVARNS